MPSRATVAIVFGGATLEHSESIRAARILLPYLKKLRDKYKFRIYYVSRHNQWATQHASEQMIKSRLPIDNGFTRTFDEVDNGRLLELRQADAIYSTMMGTSGENGNIMGLADLVQTPMVGCGILASALCLDKVLAKRVAASAGVPVVEALLFNKTHSAERVVERVRKRIGFPCFFKPYNLGTCHFAARIDDQGDLVRNWKEAQRKNKFSDKYLVEKFIDNQEVRVFVYQDLTGELHCDDSYVTEINFRRLADNEVSDSLFRDVQNKFSDAVRRQIQQYAQQLFRLFGMKDYARIDFFVERGTHAVYFNEANTQPFITGHNLRTFKRNGLPFERFFDTMVQRNLVRERSSSESSTLSSSS